jgi:hypothetical protein
MCSASIVSNRLPTVGDYDPLTVRVGRRRFHSRQSSACQTSDQHASSLDKNSKYKLYIDGALSHAP